MDDLRTPRELDMRVDDERLSEEHSYDRPKHWAPATLLPEPRPQTGYSFRWVRVSTLGIPDPRNISGMFREGWEPVRIEEQPQFRLIADPSSKFKDNIEVGGLLLCKTPTEFVEQRAAHFAQVNESQMTAVDNNFMRESDPRMPLFRERKSKVSFGKGT